jgi:hypothetical protein
MSDRQLDWFKDAVFYELHVKAFADGNGNGIGDLVGLGRKLDYLSELGVDCLWLLPMYPSPLRDDGYDISDYRSIHPQYGNPRLPALKNDSRIIPRLLDELLYKEIAKQQQRTGCGKFTVDLLNSHDKMFVMLSPE